MQERAILQHQLSAVRNQLERLASHFPVDVEIMRAAEIIVVHSCGRGLGQVDPAGTHSGNDSVICHLPDEVDVTPRTSLERIGR